MLFAAPGGGDADVGDLLVLTVDLVVVVVDGLDLDGLAEEVVAAGLVEDGLAGGELGDDCLRGDAIGG